MNYHRTLCALALGAAVAVGCSGDAVAPSTTKLPTVRLSKGAQAINDNGRALGLCFQHVSIDAPKLTPSSGSVTINAPAGKVVSRVAVKAGPLCLYTPDQAQGQFTFDDQNTVCYVVDGLGSATVTIRRLGTTARCQQIAYAQYLTAPAPAPGGGDTGGGDTGGGTGGGDTGGGSTLPPGGISVCEASMQPVSQPFGLSIASRVSEVALFSVAVGECSAPQSVQEGMYYVTQGIPEGFTVLAIIVEPEGRIVSLDPFRGMATISVASNETATVTFLNDILQ